MAHTKGKSEGGSGGRRGYSGMDHACKTEEIKDGARIVRRTEDRKLIIGEPVDRIDTSARVSFVGAVEVVQGQEP
jgi:hypothetical protein